MNETGEKSSKPPPAISDYNDVIDITFIIAKTNEKGVITYVNDNFCKLSKYSVDELIGKDYSIVNSDFHPDEFFREMWSVIASGKVWKGEIKNKAKDGSFYWVDTTIIPFFNENGAIYQYLDILVDITSKKLAEEKIAYNERRFRSLIEKAADGIALSDSSRKIMYLSPSVKEILGFEPEELMGLDARKVFSIEKDPTSSNLLNEMKAEAGKAVFFQVKLKHKNGEWRWIEATSTNQLQDPAVKAIVTNFRDITARKQEENDAAALNESLERMVAERTVQLKEANQELETFSYSVAHDLKAPLRILNGYAKLLLHDHKNYLNTDAQNLLNVIIDNSTLMGRLITDLLNFSRITRAEISVETVNMHEPVMAVIDILRQADKNIKAEFTVKQLAASQGDASLLKQVWYNLISNAVKYSSKKEEPKIEIGSEGRNGESVYYVKDNGVGFDMQNANKLFEVFQRLHSKVDFEGNGVGLALTHRIVTKHGGKIWADAKIDEGATFYFTIPESQTHAYS